MSDPAGASQPAYGRLPTEIEGFESLAELALNLRWCGTIAPTRCGGRSILSSGSSHRTPGLFCKRPRGTNSGG